MGQTSSPLVVRDYRPTDVDALMALFRTAVRQVARRDYTEAQVRAWAGRMDCGRWLERLASRKGVECERYGSTWACPRQV